MGGVLVATARPGDPFGAVRSFSHRIWHCPLPNDGARIFDCDPTEEPDLLRVGGEVSALDHQRFGVLDGEEDAASRSAWRILAPNCPP